MLKENMVDRRLRNRHYTEVDGKDQLRANITSDDVMEKATRVDPPIMEMILSVCLVIQPTYKIDWAVYR